APDWQLEFGAGQELKVLFHLAHHCDLVAIMQVAAHSRGVDPALDSMLLEMFLITYAGEHQQLRCIERTSAKNNLAAVLDADLFGLLGRWIVGRVSVVKFLST